MALAAAMKFRGQPCLAWIDTSPPTALPRACGATNAVKASRPSEVGLSPRVRDNHDRQAALDAVPGPIPARAGQPALAHDVTSLRAAYPRACGATLRGTLKDQADYGLSPRVRGNPPWARKPAPPCGPIPARAGQPLCGRCRTGPAGAYPRACGATFSVVHWYCMRQGLSPRVRGNLQRDGFAQSDAGPIPARAGQPDCCRNHASAPGAYPRACGATRHRRGRCCQESGLSPRVRGNQAMPNKNLPTFGPIPARAGQPFRRVFIDTTNMAYPRACGATDRLAVVIDRPRGLSPRVRGNLRQGGRHGLRQGPIPARAGQPPGAWRLGKR